MNTPPRADPRQRRVFAAAGLALATLSCLFLAELPNAHPNTRAAILMTLGLIVLWVVVGGVLMRLSRDWVRESMLARCTHPRVGFVMLATLLALTEELVTTSMTNAAPIFGVPVGAAYITASANYIDVVLFHSVIVFVPMFVGWTFLLSRYRFAPGSVLWLFGLTGVVVETMYGGAQAILEFGLWVFVYGLMVYLPAYAFQDSWSAGQPSRRHYAAAVILPILFAIPVALVVGLVHPVRVHFPPMVAGS